MLKARGGTKGNSRTRDLKFHILTVFLIIKERKKVEDVAQARFVAVLSSYLYYNYYSPSIRVGDVSLFNLSFQ